MKNINEKFTDEEHEFLIKAKKRLGAKNWHDFIIELAKEAEKLESK